ncbi:MAG: hypothetical protein BWY28_02187 [bacterium ADurb.Bin236]|nr:MAG: hypothetical protein BWY28_02187 [bacterium ADurb.Bin236]HPN93717.1 hypothetical protein [bacterium]
MATKKAKEITFEKAVPAYLKNLTDEGKNERTVEVYGRCLENAVEYFGADKPLGKLTPATIGAFFKSDAFIKKPNGNLKSEITLTQNRRVLRMMLVWAHEKGYLEDIPLPKAEMKKGRALNGNDAGDTEPAPDAPQGD